MEAITSIETQPKTSLTVQAYRQKYYQTNKTRLSSANLQNYYKNLDARKIASKEYYVNNKIKLLEDKKQKVICECGITYTKTNKQQHMNSAKHLAALV